MHTLLARGATAAHPNSHLPHLVLHYDSCTGVISALSSEPPSPTYHSGSEDEAMRESEPPQLRRHVDPPQIASRPAAGASATKTPYPKRQSSKLGSMMRRLIPRRSERQHSSLPSHIFTPPPIPRNYPGGYGPRKLSHGNRPVSTPERRESPQSPLTAHPMAIAGSGDAVARITQFVNQKGKAPSRGSSLPNFIFSTPGQTWYEGRELSHLSEGNEKSDSHVSSQRSLASSRHRSRSVSALSDSTKPASEKHVLRKQKSSRSLRRSKSLTRRHNLTPDVPEISALYQSGFSEEVAEPTVSELPADVPDVPHPLPQLLPLSLTPAAESEQSTAPRQTFDFSSLATAMRSQDEVNLETHEERLIAMEVKMMNLEYAISKVQGRLPSDQSLSYRKPSTEIKLASEGAYMPPPPEAIIRRKQSPPRRMDNEPSNPDDMGRSASVSSNTSTVRPSRPAPPPPSERPPPPPSPPLETGESMGPEIIVDTTTATFPRRSSITLLTVDHYSKLVSLLRHEQAARKQLAEEVSQLQAEVMALRPLAHSPLGSSYRSWRDAKGQTTEKGWAVIEQFRAGKPVGRSGSSGSDKDNTMVTPRRSEEKEQQVPPSPVVSDASSDISFGNAYEMPAQSRGVEEDLGYPGIPAGQAF